MPDESDRFSIRKRVKCAQVDEPADLAAAERLFARLCARMLLAEQRTRQRSEEDPELTEEDNRSGRIQGTECAMSRLFSYVVQHDYGYAPNPEDGLCTLAKCKYGRGGRKNIIELAEVGDWIAGTGGADLRVSAGHGKLIYAMRVEEKLTLREYHQDPRFRGRRDNEARDAHLQNRYALISSLHYYFGRNAPDLSGLPGGNLHHPFEKRGPGHRSDFTEQFIAEFARWLASHWEIGQHGAPNGGSQESSLPIRKKRRCAK